jgi:hypothetical protein
MSIRRRAGAAAGAAVLSGGLAIGAMAALPGAAEAATPACTGGTTANGTVGSCTTSATVGLSSGGLTMNGPIGENWGTVPLNGQTQTVYDTTANDEGLVASDLRGLLSTGTGSGWDITASAAAFTGTATATTIPDTATGKVLAFNGGGTSGTAANTPTAACYYGLLLCALPTNSVTFPAFVPTGASVPALRIYNAAAGTGVGVVQVGASGATHPGVWSVTLPPTLAVDTYTSTITLTIAAGP